MEFRDIQTFNTNFIAIFRPKKQTYSILTWDQQFRYWKRALVDPELQPTITVGRITIPPASVSIKIDRTTSNLFVKCLVQGKVLMYGTAVVPIIQKKSGSTRNFPNGIYAGEFTCTNLYTGNIPNANTLWTLRPVPQIENPVQLPIIANPLPINPVVSVEPIPQRIAWLIAEDACVRNEICSIILEPISPITSSVTNCFHVFETNAIKTWLEKNSTCPLCKKKAVATKAFN